MIRLAQRRVIFLTAAFVLSSLSCGREVTGPENGSLPGRTRLGALALAPSMPTLVSALDGAGSVVAFERVRVRLTREDGGIAVDTLVDFPANAESVSLSLLVPLPIGATGDGTPFILTMAYVNAPGDTVFRAGPTTVRVVPLGTGGGSQPVELEVVYTGTGANAAAVIIAPDTGTVVAGTTTNVTAIAVDGQQQPIANTPILYYTLDSTRAQVANPGSGQVTWLTNRGSARIVAALPSGARADTAVFTVSLPASQLVVGSGDAQSGTVGEALGNPVVLRTLASDNIPVAGVEVQFAVATGGGAVTVAVDTSDANGEVSTAWTLGAVPGAQTLTATAIGLAGPPVTITATAGSGLATQLAVVQQPIASIAGAPLAPALVVEARDAFGNRATTFTDSVTVALPPGADIQLAGNTTVAAVGGIATFADLSLTVVGDWTLEVASGALAPAATAVFSVAAAAAAALEFVDQPSSIAAGAILAPPVTVLALDAFGNAATTFTGPVTLTTSTGVPLIGGTLRNAVAGLATFDDLTVGVAGISALVATAPGIVPDTSADFVVSAGAATQLVLLDGALQADTVGRALAAPLRVRVTDALGNGVAGVTIAWTVASGSANVDSVASTTDATGTALTFANLGTVAGSAVIEASAAGLAGSPVAFAVTAIPGAPTALTVVSQPDSATSGLGTAPFVIGVLDTFGNPVTWFTGDVTVAVDDAPDPTFAAGTLVQSVTAGVATFDDLVFGSAGSWIIAFSSGALLIDANVEVEAGAPTSFAIVSGSAQVGIATQPLPLPLTVQLLDAIGNPVAGDTIVFVVSQGGGTLSSGIAVDSVVTDAGGLAATTWTLGADTAVVQQVRASFAGFADLVFTATAQPLIANRTWSGAVSTVWTDAANWAEGLVPTATDSVRIPAGRPNYPVLAADVNIARLTVDDGASATLGQFVIFANGSVRVPQVLAFDVDSGGIAAVSAAGGTVSGAFPTLLVQNGAYVADQPVTTALNLVVSTNARLSLTAEPVTVGRDFITILGGVLQMVSGTTLTVEGRAQFLGGSTDGLLVGGTLRVRGDFEAGNDVRAFAAGNFHTTILDGALAQNVFFSDPDTTFTFFSCSAQCFGRLEVLKATGGVAFGSTAKAMGGMRFTGESVDAGGFDLIATGNAEFETTSVEARRIGWQSSITRPLTFLVDTLVAFGAGSPLPVSESIPTIVRGGHVLVGDFNSSLIIDNGSLEINVSGSTITGSLTTRGTGVIRMIESADSLIVLGNATFGGVMPAGQLTQGVLELRGNFAQVGTGISTYQAAATHRLRLSGTTQQVSVADPLLNPIGTLVIADGTAADFGASSALFAGDVRLEGTTATATSGGAEVAIAGGLVDAVGGRWSGFTTRFLNDEPAIPTVITGNVIFAGTKTLSDTLVVSGELRTNTAAGQLVLNGRRVRAGTFRTTEGSGLVMANAADSLLVTGNVGFDGGPSTLTAGYLQVGGSFLQSGTADAFAAGPNHTTWFTGSAPATVSFTNPGFGAGVSHFGELYLSKATGVALTLASDVFVNGMLETGGLPSFLVEGPHRLTSRGAGVGDLTFRQTTWEIVDGAAIDSINRVRFENQAGTAEQLRLVRSGGALTLNGPSFVSPPTTGRYLVAVDSVFDANPFTVTVVNPSPVGTGGFVESRGEAVITGWEESTIVTWTGAASTAWTNPANWDSGQTPDATSIAVIPPAANLPVIPASTTLRGLVVTTPVAVLATGTFTVTDTLDLPAAGGIACPSGGGVNARLVVASPTAAAIGGRVQCELTVSAGTARLFKGLAADSVLVNGTGVLDVDAFAMTVDTNVVRTAEGGALRMANTNGVVVTKRAFFGGGSTAGLLTAGTLIVNERLVQSGDPASFSAGAVHLTEIRGNADDFGGANTVSFANPATSGFGSLRFSPGAASSATLQSTVAVRGDLTLDPTYFITAGSFELIVDGDVTVGTGAALNLGALRLGGTYVNAGLLNADTTEFRGSNQVIPILPDGNADGWNSVVVTGTARAAYPTQQRLQVLGSLIIRGTGSLQMSGPGEFGGAFVGGDLRTLDGGRLIMQEANALVTVNGNAIFNGGFTNGLLTAGTLEIFGDFTQLGSGPVFYASGAHQTRFVQDLDQSQNIFFADPTSADPGRSAFGNLVIDQGNAFAFLTLASDVTVQGQLIVSAADPAADLTSDLPASVVRTIFSYGANLPSTGLRLDGVRWVLQDGAPVTGSIRRLRFERQRFGFPQFEVARNGGTILLDSLEFDQGVNSTGPFLVARDETVDANALTLDLLLPTPAFHSGRIQQLGEGTITNWPQAGLIQWVGLSGAEWNDPSNWSPRVRPTAFADVQIGQPGPTLGSGGSARNVALVNGEGTLTIGAGQILDVSGDADMLGSVFAGNASSTLRMLGGATARFRTGQQFNARLVVAKDPGTAVGLLDNSTIQNTSAWGVEVSGGRLVLDGRRLQVNAGFRTIERGQLEMRNPLDTMRIGGVAEFNGETTLELLTAGDLILEGDFRQLADVSPFSFVSSGEHSVTFPSTDLDALVSFASPGEFDGSRFNLLRLNKARALTTIDAGGRDLFASAITSWTQNDVRIRNGTFVLTGLFTPPVDQNVRVAIDPDGFFALIGVDGNCSDRRFFVTDTDALTRLQPPICGLVP